MNLLKKLIFVMAHGLFFSVILLIISCCSQSEIICPPPKYNPVCSSQPTYNYEHQLQAVKRDRKPVVALLRTGDIAELHDYLPFGRTRIVEDSEHGRLLLETKENSILMGPAIRQMLMRELVESGELIVIERERIQSIIRELAFIDSKYVDKNTTVRPGRLVGVHYILEGAFFPAGSSSAVSATLDELSELAQRRQMRFDASCYSAMYLNVIDVETGEVVVVAIGIDSNSSIAVRKAVEDMLDQFAEVATPIRVVRVLPDGEVLLDIGKDDPAANEGEIFETIPMGDENCVMIRMGIPGIHLTPGQLVHPEGPQPRLGDVVRISAQKL